MNTISSVIRLTVLVSCAIMTALFVAELSRAKAQDVAADSEVPTGESPAGTFNADEATLGAIPDGPAGGTLCGDFGAAREVTFTVSGFTGPISTVAVNITGTHTWVGDLDVALLSPGGTAARLLFSQTGATSATDCGDSSDFSGPYSFADKSPPAPTWWNAAATAGSTAPVAPGAYRTSSGGAGGTGGANTMLTPTFAGLSNPQINGTWTLRVRDGGEGQTGSITAASLSLNSVTEGQHVVDMNGDGRTDWSVVRNITGGAGGQIAWFTQYSGVGGGQTDVFGSATDFFVPEDYDGDNKTDVAVWRSSAVAFFYIMRSSTSTFQAIQWGVTGDNPDVVGDYDGDNKADAAIYRAGASPGQQSFWHILRSSDGVYMPIQWGQNGDFPGPGDYDGDGRIDATVQRNVGGQGIFYTRFFNGSFTQTVFGNPNDRIVPGDYDGDGKTDLATIRGIAGQINWFYDPSSIAGTQVVQTIFGNSATDFPAQGDYDGDGRTDQSVWRPSSTPDQSAFFVNGSATGFFAFPHGRNGDYPVANYNVH